MSPMINDKINADMELLNAEPDTEEKVDDTTPASGKESKTVVEDDEDSKEGPEKKGADEEEDITEDKELDEDEDKSDELKEEEDEEEPVKVAYDRPTIKEIKQKFPEFFKEFPSIRDAIFREAEYTQLFPTIEDARDTYADAEALSSLRESALAGDPAPVFEAVEKADDKALSLFAVNLLPALHKKNPQIYSEAITPLLENIVRQAYRNGEKNNSDDLKNAALHISNFLFDTDEIATGKKTFQKHDVAEITKQKETREKELDRKYQVTVSEVSQDISKNMRQLIRKDLDPDEVLTPMMRRHVVEEVEKRINKQLEMDSAYMSMMAGRWKHARGNGYSEEDRSKIITTYLSRAKNLIPGIKSKVWEAAIGSKIKADKSKERKVNAPEYKKELSGGGAPSNGDKGLGKLPKKEDGRIDYRKVSDLDILNS